MSSQIYPVLPGLDINVKRSYVWKSGIQEALSGKQSAISYRQYPLVHYELTYNVLRRNISPDEFQSLIGLYNQMQGRFDTFLFTDPDFNTITTAQMQQYGQFGVPDGVTTAFQIVATLQNSGGPGQPEIIQNLNGPPTIYSDGGAGLAIPAGGLTAPVSQPTVSSVAGGSLGATTYYIKTAYFDSAENFSAPSPEQSLGVAANHLLVVDSPPSQAGASGWGVFVSTSSGTETWQNGGGGWQIGTNWTEPTSGLISGNPCPTTNQTGYAVGPTGIVTFNHAPPDNGTTLWWTGSWWYRCRFDEDAIVWQKFMSQYWKAAKVSFTSVKL